MSKANGELVKMAIDTDACIGAGQCEMLADDTFLVDDETVVATIVSNGMLDRERAQDVANSCPTQAISFSAVSASDGVDQ